MKTFKKGQQVLVVEGYGSGRRNPVNGVVVKVGRVWCEILREGRHDPEKFRMDSQDTGSGFASDPRFYTFAQWEQLQLTTKAVDFLRAQGISINIGSPWRNRETELAKLLGLS